MIENMTEQKEIDVLFKEVEACTSFSGAIKLIQKQRPNMSADVQAKADYVIDRLATELDGRLRSICAELHEQSMQIGLLTVARHA